MVMYSFYSWLTWVPLPDPGGPNRMALMPTSEWEAGAGAATLGDILHPHTEFLLGSLTPPH